jgi:hypothetical protein
MSNRSFLLPEAWRGIAFALACCVGEFAVAAQTVEQQAVGDAHAVMDSRSFSLSDGALTARWLVSGDSLRGDKLRIQSSNIEIQLPHDLFLIILKDGSVLRASEMKIVEGPRIERLPAVPEASRAAEHHAGQAIVVDLENRTAGISVEWRATLRDDASYFRQETTISAVGHDVSIAEVRLFEGSIADAKLAGTVKGSPVIAGNFFLGFEEPLAVCKAGAVVSCGMQRVLPLQQDQSVRYSFVCGTSQPGQMRRSFLEYLESERAHPYRTFLHYNSWYDIGYGKPYDAAAADDVIRVFGTELVSKRGVKMDSFLFDDGWDEPQSLWKMNAGFPQGLTPLTNQAHKYAAGVGIWLSPWGGYNEAKTLRLDYGKSQGFEANSGGFALSGPKYFGRFRDVTREFIEKGVNQFKIDGTGNADSVVSGSQFDSDFAAAISLMEEWRRWKPGIYVNLTTGTYPSPFWLRYADSIWRGGEDHGFTGVGSWREKWITFRDAETWRGVVQAGPLFPLNSVMLHGVIFARQAEHLETDPERDFENEVHSYFGSGTQLQELYISPHLMSVENWDLLAEAAKWSRHNADVLRDTHWVGGDPGKLQVYGWASWSPRMGILTLRNPSDQPQSIRLDAGAIFELPEKAARKYCGRSPWRDGKDRPAVAIVAGEPHSFALSPFEVLTLELAPCR